MAEMVSYVTSWLTPASLFILMNLVIGTIAVISSLGGKHKQQQQQQHQPQQQQHQPQQQFSTTHDEGGSAPSQQPPQQFSRNPSLFSRVTSFNYLSNNYTSPYSSFRSEPEYTQTIQYPSSTTASYYVEEPEVPMNPESSLTRAPSFLSRMTSFRLSFRRETDVNDPAAGHDEHHQQIERTASELTEVAEADAGKMRKTASEKSRLKKKVVPAPEEIVRRSADTPTGTTRRVLLRNRGRETSSFEEVDAKADDFINRFKQQLRLQRLDSLLRGRTTSQVTTN